MELKETWDQRVEVILRCCTQSPGWAAFPSFGKKKEVSTVADPAVDVILRAFAGVSKNLDTAVLHHRRSMAAENLLGGLLELFPA